MAIRGRQNGNPGLGLRGTPNPLGTTRSAVEIARSYTFNATASKVWDLLIDPDVVAQCLPGCEKLEPLGEDRYEATPTIGVAGISGMYQGTISIADKRPPSSYRLLIDGSGKPGFIKGEGWHRPHGRGRQDPRRRERWSPGRRSCGTGGTAAAGKRVQDDDGPIFQLSPAEGYRTLSERCLQLSEWKR